jgi:hypothetical protein
LMSPMRCFAFSLLSIAAVGTFENLGSAT